MHCNTHGTIGIAILTTTYLITKNEKRTYWIGGILAFGSHYLLDYIGEASYKSMLEMLSIETSIFIVAMLLMCFNGFKALKLAFFGFFMANLMDVIDKKLYLAILFPKQFDFTYYFHTRNPPLVNISYETTIGAAICSVILVISCWFLLRKHFTIKKGAC
ncbi:hypothetical protein [Wenyingzhuangia sp. IMCC45574]